MNSATEVFQPLRDDDPQTVSGYRLAARLGAGGMGRVYLSHTPGGRPVAIKVVRPELAEDPAFRRRFRREVEAARRVRGAYTAELIDADVDASPPWLATVYVPGPSLSEAVARRGPLPVPAVLWLMAGVAEALQVIHGAGIVHRDLKPSNVLLAADGPRVIDFGISLASDTTSPTATGSAIGTPQYMAPEQALAGETTAATDVFALGQTAAFAALGEPLYGDGPSVSVLFRIVHSEPDLSRLPESVRPLIARCLAADPDDRATPAEVVAWCRQRLGGDADAGGGPAVWREVAGPEPVVPAPVPHPTSVHTRALDPQPSRPPHSPQPSQPSPMAWQPPATTPLTPEEQRRRRRRAALIVGAVVTVSAVLLTGLAWKVMDAADRARERNAATSSAPASGGKTTGAGGSKGSGGSTGSTGSAASTPKASKPPAPVPFPQVRLDQENSIGIKDPVRREDRTGDIRLDCEKNSCALASDTSVIVQLYADPGTGNLDTCGLLTKAATQHELPLAASAPGTEICVRHSSGDIALLVIQTKPVVRLPDLPGWITADMTVWRAA
ncbi:serine/threonine protein kinase [Streptomyces sp. 2132.2]|uniref:serine/threonine-protein kinase n=1 Tax=Streptomyces sp. 2132.2 TaxID=2485161 RepID=UPI000F49FDA5|nr:serine/threonine-protein kinase [Streptomyces sp. 2132.2]ROQ97336.1 serine/threonine protein kinase [Streptomyces sp. 2132.2]